MCTENKLHVEIITVYKCNHSFARLFVHSFIQSMQWNEIYGIPVPSPFISRTVCLLKWTTDVNDLRIFLFHTAFEVDRLKRRTKNFSPCSPQSLLDVLRKCPFARKNMTCKIRSSSCYYYVTCRDMRPRFQQWQCSRRHLSRRYTVCCDLKCPWMKNEGKARVSIALFDLC